MIVKSNFQGPANFYISDIQTTRFNEINLASVVSLRRFSNGDLDRVMDINKNCLPENYSSYFFLEIYKNSPDSFLVAEAEGTLVGYIMCRIENGFSDFGRLRPAKKGHVVSIAVIPRYRKAGVATGLMYLAILALSNSGCSEAFVEVRVTNEPATQLYRKIGFEVIKRIPRYYYDGEDAHVMAIRIDNTLLERCMNVPEDSSVN